MRLPKALLAVAVIGAGALAGAVAGERSKDPFTRTDAFLSQYTDVLRLVIDNEPRKIAADDLVYASIDGMLALLDPHTNFLRPDAWAHMRERQQGSFHGIGVIISLRAGKVTIITPIEGTPAAKLGLRAGDVIEAIDGKPTEGLDLDEVARRLRGPEGTTVKVTITRPGMTQPLDMTIERAKVPTDSVRYAFMIGKDTAYIRIGDFTRTTGGEFQSALKRLMDQGATRLLLDLRDNPGGIVDSAVEVAGTLIEPGQEVFSTKGRTADSFQDYRASRDGLHFSGPLVVLVNRGSASAAEIVAGAIQDHDRGLIVGEVTFGKGVVQTLYPIRDAGLALTTAKYYTPSGRCIQRDFDSYFTYLRHAEEDDVQTGAAAGKGKAESGPAFSTDAGRKVYGGGGIIPDDEVKLSQYSERVARIIANGGFFQFAVDYLSDKPDKAAAARAFAPSSAELARFRDLALKNKWLSEKDIDAALADPTDRRDIEVSLQAEVLNAGVSLTAGYEVLCQADEQVQAALKLFGEASRLQASARKSTLAAESLRR